VKTILFACVHNAGRSQMAAAYFNALADLDQARAISAGTKPAGRVHPQVLEVLREAGLQVANLRPQLLTRELAAAASLLVTMGCGEECPHVPGLRRQDWPMRDPSGLDLEAVRTIRDEVRAKVEALIDSEGCRAKSAKVGPGALRPGSSSPAGTV
jgi:arsenate reductase